jgi:hypothetical protein
MTDFIIKTALVTTGVVMASAIGFALIMVEIGIW